MLVRLCALILNVALIGKHFIGNKWSPIHSTPITGIAHIAH